MSTEIVDLSFRLRSPSARSFSTCMQHGIATARNIDEAMSNYHSALSHAGPATVVGTAGDRNQHIMTGRVI